MFIAHLIIGLVGGLLAAAWVWLGMETSLWLVIGAYVVAGNVTCLISAGTALLLARPRGECGNSAGGACQSGCKRCAEAEFTSGPREVVTADWRRRVPSVHWQKRPCPAAK